MGFNKGEWSELYTFLYLMKQPNLVIVDENLEIIEKNIFKIYEIILSPNKYQILDNKIIKTLDDKIINEYDIEYIETQSTILLQKVLTHKKSKGSFEIKEIKPLIDDLFNGKKPKGSSKVKGDLDVNVLDKIRSKVFNLKYNIKSNLGSKATLLNASSHTNFIYEIENINDEIMYLNNNITSRKKLLDRCEFLNQNSAVVKFVKVESEAFNYNLKLIDSNLDKILAQILYLSYTKNEKDIRKLISFIAENSDECNFYNKKIGDFTNAVTFGMRAGEKWDGTNEVNGGIILVTRVGKIYLLDLVYFKDIVDRYLIQNIKLDSPSSKRYKMFEIYKEDNKYYFKLNLQIRFK
jgi:hypothetical protein